MGPMHGVHAPANIAPITAEPIMPAGLFFKLNWTSLFKNENILRLFKIPAIYKPMRTTTIPLIRITHADFIKSATTPLNIPKSTKITVNPNIKKAS